MSKSDYDSNIMIKEESNRSKRCINKKAEVKAEKEAEIV